MTIYILDQDQAECAKALDDRSLDRMIKSIAQILCNVHYLQIDAVVRIKQISINEIVTIRDNIPIKINVSFQTAGKCQWSQWARECLANYRYLVQLGLYLLDERVYRLQEEDGEGSYTPLKTEHAIDWARDNEPDLPELFKYTEKNRTHYSLSTKQASPLPLVMPKKYKEDDGYKYNVIQSYRNYYIAKLKQRMKPKFCTLPSGRCGYRLNGPSIFTRRQKPEWLGDL